jgi:hypothetical protein
MIKHAMGAAVLALGLGAAAQSHSPEERADARLAQFTETGDTRSCLATTRIRNITPLDDSRWLVTTRGGDTYLNEVSRGCFGASSPFSYIQYRIPGGQLCRGEIIRVVDTSTNMARGACGLGAYQRLEPVASEQADMGA